jgi:peptidoglycan/xylan/chitin deacetylase (PgdA/CDA1 family)
VSEQDFPVGSRNLLISFSPSQGWLQFENPMIPYSVIESCGSGRTLALTFDDGPDPEDTRGVMRILSRANITATFFFSPASFGEDQMEERCQVIREARLQGFDVQSHTYRHPDLSTLSRNDLIDELIQAQAFIESCFPSGDKHRISMIRPPYGNLDEEQAIMIKAELGATIAFWSADSHDWIEGSDLDSVFQNLDSMPPAESAQSSVLLFHDRHVVSMLEDVIAILKSSYPGYEFIDMTSCWTRCSNWLDGIEGGFCKDSTQTHYQLEEWL